MYEKAINKHLYIPPQSAHPLGVINGLVSGHVFRSFKLCTDKKEALTFIQKLWNYLRSRGYNKNYL